MAVQLVPQVTIAHLELNTSCFHLALPVRTAQLALTKLRVLLAQLDQICLVRL